MVCECGAEIREGSRFCGKCGRPVPMAAAAELANQAAQTAEAFQSAVSEDVQTAQDFAGQAVQAVEQDVQTAQAFAEPQAYPPQGMPYGNQPDANQPAQPFAPQAPLTNLDGTPAVPPPYPWERAAKVKKEKTPKPPKEPKEPKEKKPLNKKLIQFVAMGLGLILLVLGVIGLFTGKSGGGKTGGAITGAVQQNALDKLPSGEAKDMGTRVLRLFGKAADETVDAIGTVAGGLPGDVGKIAENVTSVGETVTGNSGSSFLNTMAWPFIIVGALLLLGGGAWFFLDSKKNKKTAVEAA